MFRRPPRSTRTDTLCPYTTLFRSAPEVGALHPVAALPRGSKPARKLDYQTRLCVDNAPELIRPTPIQRRILEKARRWGLGFGFAVPAHIPGGCTAQIGRAHV